MGIIGIPIGIYGYLFPGNINLMVMKLYHSRRYRFLWPVLILIVVFESIYCNVSLVFLSSIRTNLHLYNAIGPASVFLIFTMGVWMILENKGRKSTARYSVIARGIISIVIHPQQIPFWVIAGVIVSKFIPFNVNKWPLTEFVFF